jgi:hypothetical protein
MWWRLRDLQGYWLTKAQVLQERPSHASPAEIAVPRIPHLSQHAPNNTTSALFLCCGVRVILLIPSVSTFVSANSNAAATMIENTIPKYLLMRTIIVGFRAITPLSIFCVSFSIAEPPETAFRRFLLAWSVIETAFWLLVYLPRKRSLQASAQHPPPLSKEERKALFWRCWDKIPHPEYYVSRWFLGAGPGEVRRENVREFFAWASLDRGTESEDERRKRRLQNAEQMQEEEDELNEYADGIETMLGRKLEPGWGNAKSLRLTIDQVKMSHRPFIWYMVC